MVCHFVATYVDDGYNDDIKSMNLKFQVTFDPPEDIAGKECLLKLVHMETSPVVDNTVTPSISPRTPLTISLMGLTQPRSQSINYKVSSKTSTVESSTFIGFGAINPSGPQPNPSIHVYIPDGPQQLTFIISQLPGASVYPSIEITEMSNAYVFTTATAHKFLVGNEVLFTNINSLDFFPSTNDYFIGPSSFTATTFTLTYTKYNATTNPTPLVVQQYAAIDNITVEGSIFTKSPHGLTPGDKVYIKNTTAIANTFPTGTYYVYNAAVGSSEFNVSAVAFTAPVITGTVPIPSSPSRNPDTLNVLLLDPLYTQCTVQQRLNSTPDVPLLGGLDFTSVLSIQITPISNS